MSKEYERYYKYSMLYDLAYHDDVNGNCDGKIDITVVDSISGADVKPVVHGMWRILDNTEYGIDVECSECKNKAFFSRHSAAKFCPNCGADMDGGNK